MVFNFVGDVNSVSEIQRNFISSVLKNREMMDCDVLIEPVGTVGNSNASSVKRIILNQNGVIFKMVAKIASDNIVARAVINPQRSFRNEQIMYTEVFPKFRQLQINAGVPKTEMFEHPECFGVFLEAPNEVILLEDLKEYNFTTFDRTQLLTNEFLKSVLKNFAVLHSLSYALKNQEPGTYADSVSKLSTNEQQDSTEMNQLREQLEHSALDYINNKQYKAAMKGSLSKMHELKVELNQRELNSKYSVIEHGDAWIQNFMFQLDVLNNRLLKSILIDYESSKSSNPMIDVMRSIFSCTETEQRIQHYLEFIDHYHNELGKSLNNYGLKVTEIYPRDQVNDDMKRYAKLVLARSIFVTFLKTKNIGKAKIVQDVKTKIGKNLNEELQLFSQRSPEAETSFHMKLEDMVRSFIELGLFNS